MLAAVDVIWLLKRFNFAAAKIDQADVSLCSQQMSRRNLRHELL